MNDFTVKFVRLVSDYLDEMICRDLSVHSQIRCLQIGSAVDSVLSAGSLCEGTTAWNNYKLTCFHPFLAGQIDGRFPITDWLWAVRCELPCGNHDLFVDERDAAVLIEKIDRLDTPLVLKKRTEKQR